MNREQAFQMIEEAKVRLITEAEAEELGAWAEHEITNTPITYEGSPTLGSAAPGQAQHPLIDFITAFTKQTRPAANFAANFKLINVRVMPHVIKCFETPKLKGFES